MIARPAIMRAAPDQLRRLARQVRAIGDGRRADPEAIYIAKDTIAAELLELAREIEGHR